MTYVLPGAVLLFLAGIAQMVTSDRVQQGAPLCILALFLYLAERLDPGFRVEPASFRLAEYGEDADELNGDQGPARRWIAMLGGSLFRLTWPALLLFLGREVIPVADGWLMGAVALAGAAPISYCLHIALIAEVDGARVRRVGPFLLVSNMYPPSIHLESLLARVVRWKFIHPSVNRAVSRLLTRSDALGTRSEKVNFEGLE